MLDWKTTKFKGKVRYYTTSVRLKEPCSPFETRTYGVEFKTQQEFTITIFREKTKDTKKDIYFFNDDPSRYANYICQKLSLNFFQLIYFSSLAEAKKYAEAKLKECNVI